MMKMDADIVVMTMPDLNNFHIKRRIGVGQQVLDNPGEILVEAAFLRIENQVLIGDGEKSLIICLLAGTESLLSVYPSQLGGISLLMPKGNRRIAIRLFPVKAPSQCITSLNCKQFTNKRDKSSDAPGRRRLCFAAGPGAKPLQSIAERTDLLAIEKKRL